MVKFFAPALWLMNRLRFFYKFTLIFLLATCPILVVNFLLISSILENVRFAENEQAGLALIRVTRQPLEQIQQHRGMIAAYLNGDASFETRIIAKREDVNQTLNQLIQTDRVMANVFGVSGRIADIQSQWQMIKSHGMNTSSSESFAAHSAMVEDLLAINIEVADISDITLDPLLDSYYLGDALVRKIPALTEAMGQARAVGSVAASTQAFSNDSRIRLILLTNKIDELNRQLDSGLNRVADPNPRLFDQIRNKIQQNNRAVDEYLNLLKTRLLDADSITVGADEIFDNATRASNATFALYDAMVPLLDELFTQRIRSQKKTMNIAVAMMIFVAASLIYFFGGMYLAFRKCIFEVASKTREMAKGDLNARIFLESRDEAREIGDSFNLMATDFAAVIREIIESTEQLAKSAADTSTAAKNNSIHSSRQQLETDQVAAAMNEMAATVQEVANNASKAHAMASTADNETNGGRKVVAESTEIIQCLAEEIENAAAVINQLQQESDSIGSVLSVIRGIAEQTNLLALNAAIEAARAGEQGRGFAVVADEVRSLASRTQESTTEIESMIERLQSGSSAAVNLMQHSVEQAKLSSTKAGDADNSLETIAEAVSTIKDMNTQIASAAEEQSAVTDEMNKNISTISELAYETAKGAEQADNASVEMAQLATTLKQRLMQFKVS